MQHLFRVCSSLDSLVIGEGQIAGQAKKAYEMAQLNGSVGPLLNAVFQRALNVAKRVRTETGIARGHVSVSSVAVDYVRQVFAQSFHASWILAPDGTILDANHAALDVTQSTAHEALGSRIWEAALP